MHTDAESVTVLSLVAHNTANMGSMEVTTPCQTPYIGLCLDYGKRNWTRTGFEQEIVG